MDDKELTAKQIMFFDEMAIDRMAAKATLNTAMTYHSNRINEIMKEEMEMWGELAKIHGFDIEKNTWKISRSNGKAVIVNADEQPQRH